VTPLWLTHSGRWPIALLHTGGEAFDREEPPELGDAFEVVSATVGETQVGAGDEVDDRAGDDHLAGVRLRLDPARDVHGDAGHIVPSSFDLAGVDSDPHGDAQG
jgi:hypothetical protein